MDGKTRVFSITASRLLAIGLLVVFLVGGGFWAWRSHFAGYHAGVPAAGVKYTCPMHPFIISDKSGECPICGMTLVKVRGGDGAQVKEQAKGQGDGGQVRDKAAAGKADDLADLFDGDADQGQKGQGPPQPSPAKPGRAILFYRNPMNPKVTSPVPAKDEMGMDYVPVYADEVKAGEATSVEGQASVRLSEEEVALAGVKTATARLEKVERTVRTVGIVVPDETRVRHVHTKVAGWIDKLFTNFTGQDVKLGQPLLSIYSPELLASQQEFVSALKAAAEMARQGDPESKALGRELLTSARRRLELFDVPKGLIERLKKTGQPQRNVMLEAPVAGFVTAKGIYEGQQVEPGMELFTVTDLSQVWIEAELYEYEASEVKVGQEATLSLTFDPGVLLKGKVAYVFPYLSPESRTLKVRFNFPNPGLKLKPQMYANVSLALDSARGVVIPDSAVIDTGVRQVVFVETKAGFFVPRQVRLGVRGGGQAQVIKGVAPGEQVVDRANFLLDSESRLRAVVEKIGKDGKK